MQDPFKLAGQTGAVIADAIRRSRDPKLNAQDAAKRTGAPSPEEVQRQEAARQEAAIIAQAEAETKQAQQQPEAAPVVGPPASAPAKEEPKVTFPLDAFLDSARANEERRATNRAKINNAALQLMQAGYSAEQVKAWKEASAANLAQFEAQNKIREMDPSEEGFIKMNPLFSKTVDRIQGEVEQRRSIINGLQAQLRIMETAPPESDKEAFKQWSFDVANELKGPMLKLVNGIMGTSDAVAGEESRRLAPQLQTDILALAQNLTRPGLSTKMPEIQKYKKQVANIYGHLIETDNKSFNQIATNSNPEFAARLFPAAAQEHPSASFKITPRISRESPKEKAVEFGAQSSGQPGGVRRRALVGGRFVDVQ